MDESHPSNIAAAARAAAGYEHVRSGFHWFVGMSGDAALLKTEKSTR
jgi:hypothetical protein